MKALDDIKKKGQARLQNFNKKLDHVREADRTLATNKSKSAKKDALNQDLGDIDQVLDQQISKALNGIQGALTMVYDKKQK